MQMQKSLRCVFTSKTFFYTRFLQFIDSLCLHKPAAPHLCHLNKSQRFIECDGFRRVIRSQVDLPDIPETIQQSLHKHRTNAPSLILRQYQNILYIYDCLTVADGANETQKRIVLIGGKCQKRVLKAGFQSFRFIRIRCPTNAAVKVQNFMFLVSFYIL